MICTAIFGGLTTAAFSPLEMEPVSLFFLADTQLHLLMTHTYFLRASFFLSCSFLARHVRKSDGRKGVRPAAWFDLTPRKACLSVVFWRGLRCCGVLVPRRHGVSHAQTLSTGWGEALLVLIPAALETPRGRLNHHRPRETVALRTLQHFKRYSALSFLLTARRRISCQRTHTNRCHSPHPPRCQILLQRTRA